MTIHELSNDTSDFDPRRLSTLTADMVPLCALKPDYRDYLLQRASLEAPAERQLLFDRGDCEPERIYLLRGSVKLEYASGHREIIEAKQQRYPLVDEFPRPCRAVAQVGCEILRIDVETLDALLSWSQITDYLLQEAFSAATDAAELDWMKVVLSSNLFFKVPPVNAEHIMHRVTTQRVKAGEVIVRQGEPGHCCYFIKEGAARVIRRHEDGTIEHLADVGAGRCFGEDALVYEALRNASVVMSCDGELRRLEKEDFRLLLQEPLIEEVTEQELKHLNETPVFVDVRTPEEYATGHLVLSINIPLNRLAAERHLLNSHTPYIMYCDTGRRSRAAAHLLGKQGFNTMALREGLAGAGMQYQLVNDACYVLRDGAVVKA